MFEESWPVPDADRLDRGQSGTDKFSTAGKAGHEMGFDQAGRDLQVGLDVSRIDPHRHAAGAVAQIGVGVPIEPVVVLNSIGPGDFRTDHLLEFPAQVGAVEPGRHENEDLCREGFRLDSSVSRMGGSKTALGTGRVTSLMTTHAFVRPWAKSARDAEPFGEARVWRIAVAGSANRLRRSIAEAFDDIGVGERNVKPIASIFQGHAHRRRLPDTPAQKTGRREVKAK